MSNVSPIGGNQPLVTLSGGNAVTTSLVIAEGTGVEHRAVLQLVRSNLSDFEDFGRVAFEMRPFETAGGSQERTVAVLNEQHATLLMTYMRNSEVVKEFKKRLVKAFYTLAHSQPSVDPATISRRQLALAVLDAEDRADRAEEHVRELEPKAEYVDTYVADEDHVKFSTVASTHDLKESELRELLINEGWIYRETLTRWSNSQEKLVNVNRYSEYAHKKPFFYRSLNHDAPRFGGEVMHTLKITAAGAAAIDRLIQRKQKALEQGDVA